MNCARMFCFYTVFSLHSDTDKSRILMDEKLVKLTIHLIFAAWQIRQNLMFKYNIFVMTVLLGLLIHVSGLYVIVKMFVIGIDLIIIIFFNLI